MKFIKSVFLASLALLCFSCDDTETNDPKTGEYSYVGDMVVSNSSEEFTANDVVFQFDFDAETYTADITMEGMVFASAMLNMGVTLTLTLDDITYVEDGDEIKIQFTEEIPNYLDAPFSSYTFQNFDAVITDTATDITFDCSSSAITYSGKIQ